MSGTYICHLCNRRWSWPREPITAFVVMCPDCSNGKHVVLDFVADEPQPEMETPNDNPNQ